MYTNVFEIDMIFYICTELLIKILKLPKLLVRHRDPFQFRQLMICCKQKWCNRGSHRIFWGNYYFLKVYNFIFNYDPYMNLFIFFITRHAFLLCLQGFVKLKNIRISIIKHVTSVPRQSIHVNCALSSYICWSMQLLIPQSKIIEVLTKCVQHLLLWDWVDMFLEVVLLIIGQIIVSHIMLH
jgi:hypothetical protein